MQFRVPQNIAMEDRIVGPLTAIQFGILVIGGGIAFYIFTDLSFPSIVREVGGGFFAFLTVILALGRFNDQPMYRFFRYIIAFIVKPKTRIWRKTGKEVKLIKPTPVQADEKKKYTDKTLSKAELARLAAVLDSRGHSSTPIIKR